MYMRNPMKISNARLFRGFTTVIVASFLYGLSGCAVVQEGTGSQLISSVRPTPEGITILEKTVSRGEVMRALEASRGSTNVRIVPLVTSAAQAPATPEYRIFNVRPGSIAELLGLRNADVIVAAHDYVIQAPNQFYNYLQLLSSQKATAVEVRREGKPIKLALVIAD